jgi:Xaa-Pro aminopeptidase
MSGSRNTSAMSLSLAVERGANLTGRMPALDVSQRIAAVQRAITGGPASKQVDAVLITNLLNIRWCCGFSGSAGRLVIPARGRATLLTDSRYAERAAEETTLAQATVRVRVQNMTGQQDTLVRLLRGKRVGLESSHVSWEELRSYRRVLEASAVVALRDVVERLRRSKDAYEVARLARAGAIADLAFQECVPLLADGCREIDFARAFSEAIVSRGAEGDSFTSIIASGPNGSRPHHATGERRVRNGDLVICDLGALVDGYHSDMTRTVAVGSVTRERRRHLGVVIAAQAAGRDLVAVGTPVKQIDDACRRVINEAGWGEFFNHGTGHGFGLQIHEAPWVNGGSVEVLALGETCTVEPGVYLPGKVGVRIEDSMILTESGAVSITRTPYEVEV